MARTALQELTKQMNGLFRSAQQELANRKNGLLRRLFSMKSRLGYGGMSHVVVDDHHGDHGRIRLGGR